MCIFLAVWDISTEPVKQSDCVRKSFYVYVSLQSPDSQNGPLARSQLNRAVVW